MEELLPPKRVKDSPYLGSTADLSNTSVENGVPTSELRNLFLRSKTMDMLYGGEAARHRELRKTRQSLLLRAGTSTIPKLVVLTSGGDAQGMNACVRAVVRCALDQGARVYVAWNGYQGLVDGGKHIKEVTWSDVGGIISQGGTFIGTARCQVFRTTEGRRDAVANLLRKEIYNLIVVGGDGSLTGADTLFREWSDHCAYLAKARDSDPKYADLPAPPYQTIKVCGTVGSIDNDMSGTDMTIGCDSALQRIVSAIDVLSSTAASHQREFVVEVMGRNCGWLALRGGMASGSDWFLIPEHPEEPGKWEERIVERIKDGRARGKRSTIVVVSEGAHDTAGNKITSNDVKERLDAGGLDSRITILGHIQRGGSPSAFDRIMSLRLGEAAVKYLLRPNAPASECAVMCLRGNSIVAKPLSECLATSAQVAVAVKNGEFDKALSLRGGDFRRTYEIACVLTKNRPHNFAKPSSSLPPPPKRIRYAIVHIGACSPGMNSAVRSAARYGLDKGHVVLGVYGGIEGFLKNALHELEWMDVNGWIKLGGAQLGIDRSDEKKIDFDLICHVLEQHRIDCILAFGGWDAYAIMHKLGKVTAKHPQLASLAIICAPFTISNNLPCTDYSVGSDTALNATTEAIDKMKQSAVGKKRLFIIEVMGSYCGYLAMMSALATGAEKYYIHENGISLNSLQADLEAIKEGFRKSKQMALIVICEYASKVFDTNFLAKLYKENSDGIYDVRIAVLGHMQQGGDPSPIDRCLGTELAAECVEYAARKILQGCKNDRELKVCIGKIGSETVFSSLDDAIQQTDLKYRRPYNQWWLDMQGLANTLAQPGSKVPNKEEAEKNKPAKQAPYKIPSAEIFTG